VKEHDRDLAVVPAVLAIREPDGRRRALVPIDRLYGESLDIR
jgi:hypothetical protein